MSLAAPSRQTLRYLSQVCSKPLSCRLDVSLTGSARRNCPPPPPTQCRTRQIASSCHSYYSHSPSPASPKRSPQTRGQDEVAPSTTTEQAATTTLPDTSTFYSLFPSTLPRGPPPGDPSSSFAIDLAALRREFLALQSRFHPDKYDASSDTHQRALALSSLINNAYRTLSDPLLRAQYLLNLQYGIDVTIEDNSHFQIDQDTLMEVMDAQEAVEEAQSNDEVDRLKAENRQRMDQAISKIAEAFDHDDKDAATRECVRLKYWRSLQQGLEDWEPGKEVRLEH